MIANFMTLHVDMLAKKKPRTHLVKPKQSIHVEAFPANSPPSPDGGLGKSANLKMNAPLFFLSIAYKVMVNR